MSGKIRFTVSATAQIDAPAPTVYAVIADYRNGHPRILPAQFSDLRVIEGGVGAGTVITFHARVLGIARQFQAVVSEPDPGRVLVETNVAPSPSVTTFTVTPSAAGTTVTISTELETTRGGLLGAIERYVTARVLPGMYREELRKLADQASR